MERFAFKLLFSFILTLMVWGISLSAAKYEPETGCYLGAFIQMDPVAPDNILTFESTMNKKHACYLHYNAWNSAFPLAWAQSVKARGSAIQLGFEPTYGLGSVTDGPYIRKWARDAHSLRAPIFVRWASEMNLSEFIWSGNTTLYIQKWRMLYNIFKEEAPNIVMVWAPNWSPTATIDSYYPGDEYVDWVGVDMYMGLGVGTTDTRDPRSKISYVYDKYSAAPHNKPIMFPEWAAANAYSSGTISYNCADYGIRNTNLIYDNLQAEFPKMKLITWFDYDSRSINKSDFSLTNNYAVQTNYQRAIANPYYLTTIPADTSLLQVYFSQPTSNQTISQGLYLSVTTNNGYSLSSVVYWVNDNIFAVSTSYQHYVYWDAAQLPDGTYTLKVQGYTADGKYDYDLIEAIIDKDGDYKDIIIDNDYSGFSTAGSAWILSTSQPERYGDNYRYQFAGTGSSKAFWCPNFTEAGIYEVQAWWSSYPNRASNSPYTIYYSGGSTTIRVNQEKDSGQWMSLGKYYFDKGTAGYVSLSNDADEIVIADAVRFTRNMEYTGISGWLHYDSIEQERLNKHE